PDRTWYNRIADMEWGRAIGSIRFAGGDVLMRVEAMDQVGGYREDLIAGEDPELCVRLRAAGWQVVRVDEEMTRHDADMTRFGQWCRRSVRGGYVYAQGLVLHGGPPEFYCWRPTLRIWFWAAVLPAVAGLLCVVHNPLWLLLLGLYPLQMLWIAARHRQDAGSRAAALRYGFFCVLARWPQWFGQCLYVFRSGLGRRQELIEYKQEAAPAEARV
ncbi:MAG: glycosyltransferase family 2 protein, partial [Phycisphaeraceae bacterium]|nr:glycosyltransferase family 2 protein [Phycisphaeraceae bacterium]